MSKEQIEPSYRGRITLNCPAHGDVTVMASDFTLYPDDSGGGEYAFDCIVAGEVKRPCSEGMMRVLSSLALTDSDVKQFQDLRPEMFFEQTEE